MSTPPNIVIPPPNVPLTDSSGNVSKEWLAWFLSVTKKLNGL